MAKITFEEIKKNEKIMYLVNKANENLGIIGYTEHGIRHVQYIAKIAGRVLNGLGYPDDRVELAKIAGWVHDVGNLFNRKYHSISGAAILFQELQGLGMDFEDVCDICAAVGSHDEEIGRPVSDISAALIIADKVDAYKARVRQDSYSLEDIHDRVNLSIYETHVRVDKDKKEIMWEMHMKEYATPMEFMEIYFSRMRMCEDSAAFLGCTFKLSINGLVMNQLGASQA
ncbi:HD domain-containing protein [Christensenellaceae bacterium OttesenSCG-928-K19]|nr:HD domain-containing protein [Christensenellaceae bacterium OttesenSCG-928-K19]